jgi:restriction system protein
MRGILQSAICYFKSNSSKEERVDYNDLIDDYILRKKLLSLSIEERSSKISDMGGIGFENYIKDLFAAKGINCKTTPTSGDYGVDLIADLKTKKIAIQCKRYKDKVGFSAIQEVYTGKDIYGCNEAWVVTNSSFSRQAIDASEKLNIKLVNVCRLLEQIQLTN